MKCDLFDRTFAYETVSRERNANERSSIQIMRKLDHLEGGQAASIPTMLFKLWASNSSEAIGGGINPFFFLLLSVKSVHFAEMFETNKGTDGITQFLRLFLLWTTIHLFECRYPRCCFVVVVAAAAAVGCCWLILTNFALLSCQSVERTRQGQG